MAQPLPPLGSRFAALFTASSLSNLADGILSIGLGLVVITMTTSPALVSLATAAFTLPWLLLSIIAGVIIDRSDRRKVIIIATTLRIGCLGLGAIALATGFMNYALLLIICFIFGCAEVFADNAYSVLVPALVPTPRLAAANSRILSAQQVANNFLGAPLAGFLFALGAAWVFGVPTALCIGALIVIVFGLRGTYRAKKTTADNPSDPSPNAANPSTTASDTAATRTNAGRLQSAKQELETGLKYLWRHPIFRPLVLASSVQNMIFSGYFAVFILWVVGPSSRVQLAEEHYGLLFMMLAVGSVIGALTVERFLKTFHEIHVLGAAWLTAAALLIVPLLAPNVIAIAAMLLLSGMSNTVGNTVSVSLRQRLIPNDLLGRVFGASQMINLGLVPIGTVAAGLISEYAGMPIWFVAAAGAGVTVVTITLRAVPARIIPPAATDAAPQAPKARAGQSDAPHPQR